MSWEIENRNRERLEACAIGAGVKITRSTYAETVAEYGHKPRCVKCGRRKRSARVAKTHAGDGNGVPVCIDCLSMALFLAMVVRREREGV